eukprot:scaffold11900_cov73-Isochrysis_galbana.AAC.1
MDDKDLVRLGVAIRGRAFAQQLDAKRKASAPAELATPEQTPATPTPAPAAKPAAATGAHAAVGAAEGAAPAVGGAAAGDESTPPWKAEPEEFAAGCLQPILKEFMVHSHPIHTCIHAPFTQHSRRIRALFTLYSHDLFPPLCPMHPSRYHFPSIHTLVLQSITSSPAHLHSIHSPPHPNPPQKGFSAMLSSS